MQVQTDHKIIAHNVNLMQLYDGDGNVIVTAQRGHDQEPWVLSTDMLHADTGKKLKAKTIRNDDGDSPREPVILAMTEMSLAVLPETGYSTLVPHGLAQTP